MDRRWAARLIGLVALFGLCTLTQASDLRILYAEPIAISLDAATAGAVAQKPAGSSDLTIAAYGRQMELVLEPNDRVLRGLPLQQRQKLSAHGLFRGHVAGLTQSWVRLTRVGNDYYGAIWDGTELYSIAPAPAVTPFIVAGTVLPQSASYIYRLSDTQGGLEGKSCGVEGSNGTGALQKFKSLIQELRSKDALAVQAVTGELPIALIGDYEFYAANAQDPQGAMLARLNVVDGIFSDQVGISIEATELQVFNAPSDPFDATKAETLLGELATYRESTPAVRTQGLAHLLTGRVLDGNTIGIAYTAALCESRYGASLSESQQDVTMSALIFAHELGHNFGAPHDGEIGSACSTTASSFLMAQFFNYSSTFSSCSLGQMRPKIAGATCLVPPTATDVSVAGTPAMVQAVANRPFSFPIEVASAGTALARGVTVQASFSDPITIRSASVAAGSCDAYTSRVVCRLGDLAPGEARQITVDAISSRTGSSIAQVVVSAPNDRNASNDTREVRFDFSVGGDATLAGSTGISGRTRAPVDLWVDVGSEGTEPVVGGVVEIDIADASAMSASVSGGTCAVTPSRVSCNLASIAPGATQRIDFQIVGLTAGSVSMTARVTSNNDGAPYNNSISFGAMLTASRNVDMQFTSVPQRQLLNSSFTATLEVRSTGPLDVPDVPVRLQGLLGIVLESAVPAQGTCSVDGQDIVCALGAMASGTMQSIQIQARGTRDSYGQSGFEWATIVARVAAGVADTRTDLTATGFVDVRYSSDVGFPWAPSAGSYDRTPFSVAIPVVSRGMDSVQGVVVSTVVPDSFTIHQASMNGATCQIAGQTVTCNRGAMGSDESQALSLELTASQAGEFPATASLVASNDANAANDSIQFVYRIGAYTELSVIAPVPPDSVIVDAPFELVFAVTANRNPPAAATFSLSGVGSVIVESAQPTSGSCTIASDNISCALGSLPADSRTEIVVRMRAKQSGAHWFGGVVTSEQTFNFGQSYQGVMVLALYRGDAGVSVAQPSVEAIVLQSVAHPVIVVSSSQTIGNAEVLVEVDGAGLALQGESVENGMGYCSRDYLTNPGSRVRCSLGTIEAGTSRRINIMLGALKAGTFSSTVQLSADGDIDPANNTASVDFVLSDPPPPPPPPPAPPDPPAASGGKSGGGGAVDAALLLALLTLMVGVCRSRRRQ